MKMIKPLIQHTALSFRFFAAACYMILLFMVTASADEVPKLSDSRFLDEYMKMAGEHAVSATSRQAANNPYIMARLIVKSTDPHLDPDEYGASSAIRNRDGVFYLQFDSDEKARAAAKHLINLETTEYVEPDFMIFASGKSGASEMSEEELQAERGWNMDQMMFPAYKKYIRDHNLGSDCIVAVLDTGISFTHPLLADRLIKDKAKSFAFSNLSDRSFSPDESELPPSLRDKHGTHVAGIIAQCTAGFDVRILPVRVLTSAGAKSGSGSISALSEGIKYAVSQGADVINISVGAEARFKSRYLEETVRYATAKGVAVVVSSGNQGRELDRSTASQADVSIPGYIRECICVGSVDESKRYAGRSNYGKPLDVVAPGVEIWSSVCTPYGDRMDYDSGTSMAAPHVAAMAALLHMTYPDASPAQIENLIRGNAEYLGTDPHYASGFASFEGLLKRTVTFEPGAHGLFAAISRTAQYGSATPDAPHAAGEEGYVFDGWTPALSPTVEDSVIYTAKWKKADGSQETGPSGAADTPKSPDPSGEAKPSDASEVSYRSSRPQANVSYTVPLKKKQETGKLKVVGLKDGDQTLSWESSDRKKASVRGRTDGTCVIRAGNKTGTVKITARTASGRSVVFRLKVLGGKVRTGKINISAKTVRMSAGSRYKLEAVPYPITSSEGLSYTSDRKHIVSVSKSGTLTARSEGTAFVTIKSGKEKITVKVIVKAK